ncbi:uncharacterized protein LOC134243339, partial [Saccostrea cucullata]|uniref:uncharacterized protein LOC134243339 n=1 Tax=Saccostrea cuccullata TaxID=36930 RepID=UPI002ECFAF1A
CPQGYFGPKCEHACPYPTYGYRCLGGRCICPKEKCNNTHGCLSEESTTFGSNQEHSTSMFDKTRQVKSEPSRKNKSKEWSDMIVIIALSSVSTVAVSMIVMVVLVFRRGQKKANQTNPNRMSYISNNGRVTSYYEIDDRNLVPNRFSNQESNAGEYVGLDEKKIEKSKYTALPQRK